MGVRYNTFFITPATQQITPTEPRYAATSAILSSLENNEFKFFLKTVQHDLSVMATYAPFLCIERECEHRWRQSESFNEVKLGFITYTVRSPEFLSGLLQKITIGPILLQFNVAKNLSNLLSNGLYVGKMLIANSSYK